MELASMLAGEPFSDHPRSVSRTIGAFLRCYNDLLDDRRRQDLYAYAAKVVGTAASPGVEYARATRLMHWADARRMRHTRFSLLAVRKRRAGPQRRLTSESAARYATRTIRSVSDETHAKVLGLIEELIGLGVPAGLVRTEDSPTDALRRQPDYSARIA